MTKMKFLLAASLTLTLAACGGSDKADTKPVKAPTQTSAPVQAEKPTPKPEPKKVVASTPAENAAPPPKPLSGKRLYMRRSCMACHGKNGARGIQEYPNIAGLDAIYMRAQIRDILSGKRKGSADALTGAPRAESMHGALVTPEGEARITADEIKIVSAWLSEQTPAGPQVHEPALSAERIAAGKAGYEKAKCKTCHGVDGNKPNKGYPHLAGQKSAYLLAQLKDIRNKDRTNSRSKMMTSFVSKLSDEQMAEIADYLSQINPNAQ